MLYHQCIFHIGLAWWLSGKEFTCHCRRHRFDPWVRKIFWMRAWQPTLVLLPRESHEQRILEGCGPYGHTESDTTEATKRRQQQQQQHLLPESTSMTK